MKWPTARSATRIHHGIAIAQTHGCHPPLAFWPSISGQKMNNSPITALTASHASDAMVSTSVDTENGTSAARMSSGEVNTVHAAEL